MVRVENSFNNGKIYDSLDDSQRPFSADAADTIPTQRGSNIGQPNQVLRQHE